MRFSSRLLLSAAALASLADAAPCTRSNGTDLTVQTRHATIHGTTEADTPDVRQFLGIPFARPPLGDLRFAPPQPIVDHLGEVKATQLPPACMEWLSDLPSVYTRDVLEFNNGGGNNTGPVSEDCLKVSVWAPRGVNAKEAKLPVLLWVYGGSFATGSTNIPYQQPTRWVQRSQSHIVVAFNYRVNIFGFPNAAGLPADQQNLGLLDQRLAVEWVRDNIAAFGGDPARIGLWGESAGAISVGYYSFAYPENPIVNSLFMDSGSEELDISSKDTKHSNFTYVATHFGCGGLAPAAELACVRKLDAQAVTDFLHRYNDEKATPALTFTPIVDDKTVFANYSERTLAGKVAKIPAIIGSNAQDGVTFVPYNPDGVDEALAKTATSNYFFCPTWKAATNRLANGLPVYRYRYAGNFSNIAPRPWLGAWHGSELPMLFGTHSLYRGASTAFQNATSAALQDAWVALVAGGPAALEAQHWPAARSTADARVREFGKAGVVAAEVGVSAEEAACPASLQPVVRA